MVKKTEDQGTKEARERSKETLTEQSKMRPVPSQEDADKIKRGERVDAEEDQPDGPASRAAEEVTERNAKADNNTATSYQTRNSKGE